MAVIVIVALGTGCRQALVNCPRAPWVDRVAFEEDPGTNEVRAAWVTGGSGLLGDCDSALRGEVVLTSGGAEFTESDWNVEAPVPEPPSGFRIVNDSILQCAPCRIQFRSSDFSFEVSALESTLEIYMGEDDQDTARIVRMIHTALHDATGILIAEEAF
jgi:hypothetical protein